MIYKYGDTIKEIFFKLKESDKTVNSKTDDLFFNSILNSLSYQEKVNEVVYIFIHLIKGHYLTNGNKRLATSFYYE